ncbi:MAG: efflux RND transporter periplasmic adaptor subunit [Bacteroidetes bacterium]|nr:efflux RND transporter periplasmic adaptor subunit [Bacteroidota bacterium]MCL5737780.1 efflux RND transporter periplasmic adaptor subunit [Bacteroidota bacterium]
MIRTVLIGIVVIALGSAAYFYLSVGRKDAKSIPVKLEPVRCGTFVASVSAEGTIVARRKETLVSPIAGTVHDKGIKVGEHVRKGAIIAYVSLSQEDAVKKKQDYEFARMDLDVLVEQLAGSKQLLKAKAISEQDFKALEIRKLKQEMTVHNLHDDLMSKPARVSFDGILVEKQFNDGDHVSTGASLCTLIDPRSLVVQISVPQHLMADIKLGRPVEYSSDTFQRRLEGKVIELPVIANDKTNQQNGMPGTEPEFSVIAMIDAKSDKFLIGSRVTANFILAVDQEALFVPEDAVLFREGHPVVFVLSSGRAVQKQVKLGLTNDHFVEILSGLGKTDTVVTTGNIDLADGNKIENKENGKSIYPSKSRSGPIFVPQ